MDPLLRVVNNPSPKAVTCASGTCDGCPLNELCNKQRCSTVRGRLTQGAQYSCRMECNSCGGGSHQFQWRGKIPAVCCKSPMGREALARVMREDYDFKKRPLLKFGHKHVVTHTGLIPGAEKDCYPEGTEMVACNLNRLWTPRGWHSRDLRDYLKIPSKKIKLIMFSCAYDDILERAYEHEVHFEDFASLGLDAWEIYEMSIYSDYSNFYNFWMGYRMLHAGEASGSWFGQMSPSWLFDKDAGEKPFKPWRQWAKAAPQLTINWHFTKLKDATAWRRWAGFVRHGLRHLPEIKALWFQGVSSPDQVYNLSRAFPEHDCYFLAGAPWVAAKKRRLFTERGGVEPSPNMDRPELLLENQRNFASLVARAVSAAKRDAA